MSVFKSLLGQVKHCLYAIPRALLTGLVIFYYVPYSEAKFGEYIDLRLSPAFSNIDLTTLLEDGNEISSDIADLSFSSSDSGLGVNLTFSVWRWLSAEVSYISLGKTEITSKAEIRKSGLIDYNGTSIMGVLSYPQVKNGLQIHLKAGLFSLAHSTSLDYVQQRNDTGLSAGGSLSYLFPSNWGWSADFYYHGEGLQVISIGVKRRLDMTASLGRLGGNQPISLAEILTVDGEPLFVPIQNISEINLAQISIDARTRDIDGDGVSDDVDQCPATPFGSAVNAVGCATASSFDISALSNLQSSTIISDDFDNTLLSQAEQPFLESDRAFEFGFDDFIPRSLPPPVAIEPGSNVLANSIDFDIQSIVGDIDTSAPINDIDFSDANALLAASAGTAAINLDSALDATSQQVLDNTGSFNQEQPVDPFEIQRQQVAATTQEILLSDQQQPALAAEASAESNNDAIADQQLRQEIDQLKDEIVASIDQQDANVDDSGSNLLPNFEEAAGAVPQDLQLANQNPFADDIDQQLDATAGQSQFEAFVQPLQFSDNQSELDLNQQSRLLQMSNILRDQRNYQVEIQVDFDAEIPESRQQAEQITDRITSYLRENGVNGDQIVTQLDDNSDQANQAIFSLFVQ